MANRHSNKKQRAAVRARMARTGETYQRALEHVRAAPELPEKVAVECVTFDHYGQTAMMVISERFGIPIVMFMPPPLAAGSGQGQVQAMPRRPTFLLLPRHGTN